MAERKFIKEKFDFISRRYDIANSLLSAFLDKIWRMHTVRLLGPVNYRQVLDVCAGTLPLTFELLKFRNKRSVGFDLSDAMLRVGREKSRICAAGNAVGLVCGAGEKLPFRNCCFEGAMVGFGVRNLEDIKAGLSEIFRILKPEGRLVILEFSRPVCTFVAKAYKIYLFHVLPRVAGIISGERGAYEYLARSIYEFMDREELCEMLSETGFQSVQFRSLTLGIVTIYKADKI